MWTACLFWPGPLVMVFRQGGSAELGMGTGLFSGAAVDEFQPGPFLTKPVVFHL